MTEWAINSRMLYTFWLVSGWWLTEEHHSTNQKWLLICAIFELSPSKGGVCANILIDTFFVVWKKAKNGKKTTHTLRVEDWVGVTKAENTIVTLFSIYYWWAMFLLEAVIAWQSPCSQTTTKTTTPIDVVGHFIDQNKTWLKRSFTIHLEKRSFFLSTFQSHPVYFKWNPSYSSYSYK